MEESQFAMLQSNDKENFDDVVKVPIDVLIIDDSEVKAKLDAIGEGAFLTFEGLPTVRAGACFEPPPEYSERDPLKSTDPEGSNSFGSSSSDDGSFWDDDDDVESDPNESDSKWSDLDTCGRVHRVTVQWIGKFLALLALLYIFICSLDFLSSAFRILGGKTAGGIFTNNDLLRNPVAGLMIGILATVLVQSSSTSTSIIVTMVGSGILEVQPAVPLIMGANIGTSVTNTFVSMAQSGDRREFRRAFAGATVHDMFNWLTVFILLPIEAATGYLYKLTHVIVSACKLESSSAGNKDFLKALTKPFTKMIVQVDKKVISKIAEGHEEYMNKSLIKKFCQFEEVEVNTTITVERNVSEIVNGTMQYRLTNVTEETLMVEKVGVEKCFSIFSQLDMGDTAAGVLLLLLSLAVLCTCLVLMVKLLHSLLQGSIAKVIKKTLNADFPGCFGFLTGYVAMIVGAVMTILVQSSSVFTSALTPLVGIGMIKLERMYPLTLGSNIGTTGTGILAALAASGDKLPIALQIALCHLFFNISGIILFYPIPHLRKMPIKLAKYLGTVTSQHRWFAIVYLILMFFLLPMLVFTVSLAGPLVSICVGSFVGLLVSFIVVLNLLQSKCSKRLPKCLRTWEFLPSFARSLEPYDNVIVKTLSGLKRCCPCCVKCCTPKTKPSAKAVVATDPRFRSLIVPGSPIVRNSCPNSSTASSVLLLDRMSTV